MTKTKATFRLTRFDLRDGVSRWVAIAWNYDEACLIATADHPTYTGARTELQALCDARNVELRWFDGEYARKPGDDLMYPIEDIR